ncbi:unnamed protein product [Oncorhynchus mykiss]|uniref:B30.2/SPRY domain-containing protein n=1 Tax=Oncorhynchus mykiss TaxID=8022 RepID=A0A060XGE1_ONCMY|nr:unnamed protein product [Oncorhynchus mykiss]
MRKPIRYRCLDETWTLPVSLRDSCWKVQLTGYPLTKGAAVVHIQHNRTGFVHKVPWLSIGEGQDTELFWDYLTVNEYNLATITMGCLESKTEEQIQSPVDSTTKDKENPSQSETQLKLSPEKDINQARSHEVDVTLDVDTAHPKLKINGNSLQWIDESPQRNIDNENCFNEEPFVLGKMGSPLKTYWEVNVKEKEDWVLGVAKAMANRKGPLAFSPTNGFWVIRLSNGQRLKAMEDEEHVLDKGIPDYRWYIYNKTGHSYIHKVPWLSIGEGQDTALFWDYLTVSYYHQHG